MLFKMTLCNLYLIWIDLLIWYDDLISIYWLFKSELGSKLLYVDSKSRVGNVTVSKFSLNLSKSYFLFIVSLFSEITVVNLTIKNLGNLWKNVCFLVVKL